MPEKVGRESDGESAFNKILDQVARRPLEDFMAKLETVSGEQNSEISKLAGMLEDQGTALHSAKRALDNVERRLSELEHSQQDLRVAMSECARSVTDSAQQTSTITGIVRDALGGGVQQLAATVQNQMSAEIMNFREAVDALARTHAPGQEQARAARSSPIQNVALILLLMLQVGLILALLARP